MDLFLLVIAFCLIKLPIVIIASYVLPSLTLDFCIPFDLGNIYQLLTVSRVT